MILETDAGGGVAVRLSSLAGRRFVSGRHRERIVHAAGDDAVAVLTS